MKYEIELGTFVSVYRHRKMIVHAENEVEAIQKAEERFYDVQQKEAGNMCGTPIVNSVNNIPKAGFLTCDEYIEKLR